MTTLVLGRSLTVIKYFSFKSTKNHIFKATGILERLDYKLLKTYIRKINDEDRMA
jgi:Txe/YoeB family toxin of Txe-Axe toxin-antitoxin module